MKYICHSTHWGRVEIENCIFDIILLSLQNSMIINKKYLLPCPKKTQITNHQFKGHRCWFTGTYSITDYVPLTMLTKETILQLITLAYSFPMWSQRWHLFPREGVLNILKKEKSRWNRTLTRSIIIGIFSTSTWEESHQ